MKKIFISYSRQDQPNVELLAKQLKARGLSLWRDVEDLLPGASIEAEIRETLATQCHGCLVYLTPNSLTSSFVMKVELKEAMERVSRDRTFSLIPIFHGVTFDEVKNKVPSYSGQNLANFNGVVVDAAAPPDEIQRRFAEAAHRLLRMVLDKSAAEFLPDPARKLILDLHTRDYKRRLPEPDIDLDWRKFISVDDTIDQALCSHVLWPALNSVEKAVAETLGTRPLYIRPSAQLSCGVALGYAFRATTGFQLEIEQPIPNQTSQVWRTTGNQPVSSPLQVTRTLGDINADGVAVELSVARLVTGGVDQWVQQNQKRFRLRVAIKPASGNKIDITSSDDANAIAQQVADETAAICDEYQPRMIHLFMAVPLALAILIGYRLNAKGLIQLYDPRRPDMSYIPAFKIE